MASKVKIALGVVGGLFGLGVLGVAAGAGSVFWQNGSYMGKSFETHRVDFPIPFPLTEDEIATLRAEKLAEIAAAQPPADAVLTNVAPVDPATAPPPADPLAGVDLQAIALERAIARGEHLVNARYVCVECHGPDFGGGTMIDDPMIGTMKGKNLTAGKGGVTGTYTAADWDRTVRHGVAPDGTPLVMPSGDFFAMSDRELSDIIAYIQTKPPVDAEIPDPALGPLGRVLMAAGKITLSAYMLPDHAASHIVDPPATAPTAEFGKHISQICTGCHQTDFAGGKMDEGDPSWAPVGNITPHPEGIGTWTFEQFDKTMRSGIKPDGTPVKVPMVLMVPYASRMTDVEMQALWAYLQTVPPLPDRP